MAQGIRHFRLWFEFALLCISLVLYSESPTSSENRWHKGCTRGSGEPSSPVGSSVVKMQTVALLSSAGQNLASPRNPIGSATQSRLLAHFHLRRIVIPFTSLSYLTHIRKSSIPNPSGVAPSLVPTILLACVIEQTILPVQSRQDLSSQLSLFSFVGRRVLQECLQSSLSA